MSIALTDDHKALADTASELLAKRDARGANRALLEAADEPMPAFWDEVAGLGWLGLHVPESHGGSGFGLPELVVVVEELGRAIAPGPFVPTVIASATIAAAAPEDVQARLLPGLADGSVVGAVAVGGDVTLSGGQASGSAVVLGGGLADLFLLEVGDDVAVVEASADGVTLEVPANLDQGRRSARRDPGRGCRRGPRPAPARSWSTTPACCSPPSASAWPASARSRPPPTPRSGSSSVARSPCSRRSSTTAPTCWSPPSCPPAWSGTPPGRLIDGGDEFSAAAAMAATVALPAADECANLNIQVHGGIGFTWEHDAHLYLRRATAIAAVLDANAAAEEVVDLTRRGVKVNRDVELPPEAEPIRDEVRAFAERIKDLSPEDQRTQMIETGYVQPHWPKPWGREAGAGRAAGGRAGVRRRRHQAPGLRDHRLGHPHHDPARHRGPGRPLGAAHAEPGGHLVPAVQRARCRLRRRRGQDQGHAGRRRLAGQRPEGLDQRRPSRLMGPRDRAHRPRRPQARRHHHDGHRHARPRVSRCDRCA